MKRSLYKRLWFWILIILVAGAGYWYVNVYQSDHSWLDQLSFVGKQAASAQDVLEAFEAAGLPVLSPKEMDENDLGDAPWTGKSYIFGVQSNGVTPEAFESMKEAQGVDVPWTEHTAYDNGRLFVSDDSAALDAVYQYYQQVVQETKIPLHLHRKGSVLLQMGTGVTEYKFNEYVAVLDKLLGE